MNTRRSPRKELHGPRPSPLKICKDSHKIRKPAPAIPAVPSMPIINRSQPMIIYMQSPKIIHAEVQDFMTLVQRLTGSSSSSADTRNSDHPENLAADHDDSTVHQASAATSVENIGISYTDNTSDRDFVDPKPLFTTIMDKNQEIGSRASEAEAHEHELTAQSSASTIPTTPVLPPFSPNFMFPSPRFNFSPRIFQDLPPMTPSSDHFFYSTRDFYRISEALFSPSPRPPLNTLTMLQLPSPTALDLYNNNQEH